MKEFLAVSKFIDFDHPSVAQKAQELAKGATSSHELIKRSFEFVRDEIKHSYDFKLNPVTCKASDVLSYGTGYCFAKSHLLAALLRFNHIPIGLCYQRLSLNGEGAPFCLHGLNAVYLPELGWYRMDARGNKPDVKSEFCPPVEMLAFSTGLPYECDLPEVWSEPLPSVIAVLESSNTYDEVSQNLPDIQVWV